ncbi:MAG: hypothetical protein DMG68_12760 [Acidobacteria bacterium]|nr:MAG: hypothetical protein DMG68_12760 [Acidobacteriota bacterium]
MIRIHFLGTRFLLLLRSPVELCLRLRGQFRLIRALIRARQQIEVLRFAGRRVSQRLKQIDCFPAFLDPGGDLPQEHSALDNCRIEPVCLFGVLIRALVIIPFRVEQPAEVVRRCRTRVEPDGLVELAQSFFLIALGLVSRAQPYPRLNETRLALYRLLQFSNSVVVVLLANLQLSQFQQSRSLVQMFLAPVAQEPAALVIVVDSAI